MVQESALIPVIDLLNELKIPYMLIGALAVNYYSVPRLTHDADILVEMKPEHAQTVAKRLQPAYYADADSIRDAIASRGESNLIHLDTGFKIDLWILEDTEFDRLRFSRRAPGRVFGRDVFLSTPEDLILTKLVWFKQSDSQKHYLDAIGVYRAQKAILHADYLRDQAVALSVAALLKRLEDEAESA
jgi:hypothetical protein